MLAGKLDPMPALAVGVPLSSLLLLALAVVACRAERVHPRPEISPAPPLMPVPPPAPAAPKPGTLVNLEAPRIRGEMSLEQALATRRSVRHFRAASIPMADLGQLAWAAQGVTDQADGLRTAPSAGALYPLELYFVTGDGTLRYVAEHHAFERVSARDLREELAGAVFSRGAVLSAPCDVVIASTTQRTAAKYGDRASRYVALEAGHAAQNLLLEATARGLAGVPIGAFDDRVVSKVLHLAPGEEALYIVALGYAQRR
jgi:SagB-type dehydrogenase family enzyme